MTVTARPLRVLFIIDWFHRTGGTEMHLARLVQWLTARGVHCEIVIFDMGRNELLDELRARGVAIHHLPVAREYSPAALKTGLTLARLIRRQRFDVAQTFHQKSDTYGALIAKLAGIPHIISSKRDTGVNRKPHHFFLNRRLRSLFEKTIVVSEAVAAAVVATNRVDRASIEKVYNGVDSVKFAPPEAGQRRLARERFGFGERDLVVGMVAGFRPEKEHRVLLEAATLLKARVPELKLLLIGDGVLRAQLREQYGPQNFVNFAGEIQDVWSALMAMDIGCLSSANEGFSNAIVEMMATGLPMVVTDVGGNAEAVEQGGNGYIIPPRDVGALAHALGELLVDAGKRRTMGQRSRQLVLEKFSEEQMCERHDIIYRELCSAEAAAVDAN